MKVKITIEETISKDFEVEVSSLENAYEEIRAKYKTGEIELDPGCQVQSASVQIGGNDSDWLDLDI